MAATVEAGTPAVAPNGAAPPPAVTETPEVSDGAEAEGDLIAKALAELNGEEAPAEKPAPKKPEPDPEKKPEPDEHQLSAAFAKLSAEQKRFAKRKEEQSAAHNEREAKIKADREALDAEMKEFRAAREGAKGSPLAALKALGWTYDQLVEYVAKEGVVPTEKLRSDLKLELDEASKASKAELEEIKKDLAERKAEKQREENRRSAEAYEQRVFSEIDSILAAEPAKYGSLARIPREKRNPAILSHMVRHYQESGDALAISDAMLYGEKEAKEYAAWFVQEAARQEGAVKPANPGAAKPETEARPISQRETTVRGVQKVDPDEMTEEEREAEALRILASGE